MGYDQGDIVKVSSADTETIGLINQVDDGILLVGSRWYFVDENEITILHKAS